jgi:hypothetical protein
MVALQGEVDRVSKALERQLVTPAQGLYYSQWFGEIRIKIPETLTTALQMVSEFPGPNAEAVVDAVSGARSYNGHIGRYEPIAFNVSGKDWSDMVEMMKTNLKLVRDPIACFFDHLDKPKTNRWFSS